jgi:integral membrane protein
MTNHSLLKQFRTIALAEGVSYLLFAITMPLKRIYEIPEPNKIVGYIHGILFIIYVVWAIWCYAKLKWNFLNLMKTAIASLLPFGTFFLDHHFLKKEALKI